MTSERRPRISVVTPSFNQAAFLEASIRSVLGQGYPNLEYIVVDGGSTDGSVEIIKAFDKDLAYWVSEPDGGHYDGLNKGFRRATGDILAWLNSDDMYTPWAFAVVASVFEQLPEVQWLSTLFPLLWDEQGAATLCTELPGFDRATVLRHGRGVQQESTFWRRSLWERAGGALDTSFAFAADLELWARFWRHADLHGVATPLAGARRHRGQRHILHRDRYLAEAVTIARRYGWRPAQRTPVALQAMRRVITRGTPAAWRPWLHRLGLCRRGLVVEQRNREGRWTLRAVHFP